MRNVRVTLILTTSLLFCGVQLLAVGPSGSVQHASRQVDRLTSVAAKGPIVTLTLQNGTSIDVPAANVRIHQSRMAATSSTGTTAMANGQPRRAQTRLTVEQLAATGGRAVPAVATVVYNRDGSVKRARIQVFASDADVSSFMADREQRMAAARARAASASQQR